MKNPQENEDQENMVDDDEDEDKQRGRKIHYDDSLPLRKRMKQHGNEIPRCYVCKKSFPSLKSLYGHMKLHGGSNSKAFRPPSPKLDSSDDGDGVSSSCNDNINTDVNAATFLVNLAKIEIGRHGIRDQSYCWKTSTFDGLGDQMPGKKAMQEPLVRYKDNPSSKKLRFDGTSSTGPVSEPRKGKRKASMEDDENGDKSRVSKQLINNTPQKIKIVFRGEDPKRDVALHDQTKKLQIPRKPQVESSKTLPTSPAMGTRSWNSSANKSDGTSAKMGESRFSTKYAAKRKYKPGHVPTSTKEAPLEHNIKQFVCNICNKKFTTFQALGGHRTVHNSKGLPVKEAPTAPEVRASTDNEDDETEAALHKEARDDAKGWRKIDFDLNQLLDEDGAA